MAVADRLPVKTPSSAISTSSSSSSKPEQRRLSQVATENSSSFIQFPTSSRRSSLFVPVCQRRTSLSSTSPVTLTTDTQSISNKSKSSTTSSNDHKRSRSQHGFNPILNNPLLNHRREQPNPSPINISTISSRITRLNLSPKQFKMSLTRYASKLPLLAHHTECTSDKLITPRDSKTNDQQEVQYVDKNKHDYITRWLHEVRSAVCSRETILKKRYVQI